MRACLPQRGEPAQQKLPQSQGDVLLCLITAALAQINQSRLPQQVVPKDRAVDDTIELTMSDALLRVFRVPAGSRDQPDPPYSSAGPTTAGTRDMTSKQCLCGCRSCLCAAMPVQPLPEIQLIIRVELPFPRPIPEQGYFLHQQFICHELPPIIPIRPLPMISEAPCPHLPVHRL